MENTLNRLIRIGLYGLAFLLPIFFLPWTFFPVALNKQVLLAGFCFLILILWLVQIIISGKLKFIWNNLSLAILLFLFVLGISTVFSKAKIQSFWGMAVEPDTLFSFILYGLSFFFLANLLSKNKEIFKVILLFLASSGILAIGFLIQCFFNSIFPWDFTRVSGFNPISSVQSLAIFLGGSLVILIAIISLRPIFKGLFLLLSLSLGVLFFVSLIFINYWASWLAIALAMTIILLFTLLQNIHQTKIFILPLIVLVIALILTFMPLPSQKIVSLPSEVHPTYQATLNIAQQVLNQSAQNFILGSGPATFAYDYDLYRSLGPNLTDFWAVRFNQGAAVLPTLLATTGLAGILSVLFIIFVFLGQGYKILIKANQKSKINLVQIAALIGSFYFLIAWFLYSANFTLIFVSFLMLGLFTANGKSGKLSFSFTKSPQITFFIMLLCVLCIVGSVLGIYQVGQKYIGALAFAKGISLVNAPQPDLDQVIANLNKAINFDKKDTYFRNLSQVFLFKVNQVLNDQTKPLEQRQKEFQENISGAEISATTACQINPANSQNWLQLAMVYENFIPLGIQGAEKTAVLSYQRAAQLAPQNPQIPFNLGRVYKSIGNLELATKELQKSIQLKPDFAPAYDLLAQIKELK